MLGCRSVGGQRPSWWDPSVGCPMVSEPSRPLRLSVKKAVGATVPWRLCPVAVFAPEFPRIPPWESSNTNDKGTRTVVPARASQELA